MPVWSPSGKPKKTSGPGIGIKIFRLNKILIISPHFPPSNLAAVHRSRLFAQHLPSFGWEPVVLTVHEDFYEELPDSNLEKLLPARLRVEKVKAFRITRPRVVGDIGMRGFFQLYKRAKQIIKNEQFDFLYIMIPSFYTALLGRWLHHSTGIPYGIDYIDPWVHVFPGSENKWSRHWLSTRIARILEPIAVKRAAMITGVAEGYYQGVIERNPHLKTISIFGAMPYGGEESDHQKVNQFGIHPYLFKKEPAKIQLVYAGAMLPKAFAPLERIFMAIQKNREEFSNIEFHFIGTGKSPNDPLSFNIKPLAEKYGLWQNIVFEYPKRIPYLDVIVHLQAADGIFILGSTEPHYTPSKVYQGVLSGKPVFAVLHEKSSAVGVIRESGAGMVLAFNGETDLVRIETDFTVQFKKFLEWMNVYHSSDINRTVFEEYSARNITRQLSVLLNKAATQLKDKTEPGNYSKH
jgi:hypothetical protein